MQSPGPEPRAGPSPRWAGGVRVVVRRGCLGVYGPGSHKVTVSEARSEHFLFPCDSIAAPKAPSVGTSLRA